MDLSREFIQYHIDNPHNILFKSIIGYEDREDTIEGFKRLLKMIPPIKVDDTAYVITKYGSKREIVECRISKMTYTQRFSFTAKGNYSNGNPYNANFSNKSIGKNVFLNREEAEKRLMCLE